MRRTDDLYNFDHELGYLANHTLEVHVDTPNLKAWYLRSDPKRRLGSTLILSTVEGLVIMGDLCPGQNGVISCYGYGDRWFAGQLSPSYLCEKFLKREFVPELGVQYLRERIIERRREGDIDRNKARDVWNEVYGEITAEDACRIICDIGDDYEGCGHGFNPSDRRWLCAIQQRFAELYQAAAAQVAA